MIRENIKQVENNIKEACGRSGRREEDVTLIAVSKTKPLELIQEAYDCGCRDFGENKAQELADKAGRLPDDIRWHMIGHLQTNKVKYVVGTAYMIHSVDSLRLAEAVSREAVKKSVRVKVLIEVNAAGEESKFGVSVREAEELVRQAAKLPNLDIQGLMTVAPFTEKREDNRKYFSALRQLSVDIMQKNIDNVNMNVLSMGMTGDYETAVEEGAVFVRVGTGIFGERQYHLS